MNDSHDPTEPAIMDRWLPYLSPEDCDAALRLAETMSDAGLVSARLVPC